MLDFGGITALCAGALVVLQAVTCAVALRARRFRLVDQVWGPGLAGVAVLSGVLGSGDPTRRIILGLLITMWGVRLSAHIARRSRGAPEDPRYAELVAGHSIPVAGLKVFGLQAAAQWFISLPIQVAATSGPPSVPGLPLVALGTVLILTGLVIETAADRQLAHFTADPAHHGRLMDRGLWAWSRHPNYFGDATVWVGVFLVAAAAWPGPLTVVSPAAMVWFLVVATGARRLERHLADRPGYRDYQQRTSFFLPRPPRHTPGRGATSTRQSRGD
ncbi:DUF1295 domain-containing protein [Flexivirga oryzae]|uniref:Steroid 5-alpha reductase family enzyme n=1 Tax=Flexivirga oryzae TaxID=1794944 RepID=A0A839N1D9_9MICO|nr:DUF1295 domain-containing protein [Flexivirga oryzae]MBB2891570.1 steroid 5-alpha reductase family enzyme [Flexivirga oryzae]